MNRIRLGGGGGGGGVKAKIWNLVFSGHLEIQLV